MAGPVLWFLLVGSEWGFGGGVALAIVAIAIMMLGGFILARAPSLSSTDAAPLSGGREALLQRAKNLIAAERHEDAARIYEHLGMWEEAGDVRHVARQQVVTHVQVNLNELIEKLRDGGLAINYSCPSCGAAIRISGASSSDALANCEYCGSVLQTADLTDFLAKVIGYRWRVAPPLRAPIAGATAPASLTPLRAA